MAYTFGNGNGTQRQQNNIPIQERNRHRGWGCINPAFFVLVAYTSWVAFQCAVGVFRGLLLNWQKTGFIMVAGIAFTVKLWSLY